MKFTVNQIKKLAVMLITLPVLAVVALNSSPVHAGRTMDDFDAAAVFKAKCLMCHGAKAEKRFDPTLPEEQLVEAILKGKKVDKPPFMPEYASKGITEEQAKVLIAHMKQLKAAASE